MGRTGRARRKDGTARVGGTDGEDGKAKPAYPNACRRLSRKQGKMGSHGGLHFISPFVFMVERIFVWKVNMPARRVIEEPPEEPLKEEGAGKRLNRFLVVVKIKPTMWLEKRTSGHNLKRHRAGLQMSLIAL